MKTKFIICITALLFFISLKGPAYSYTLIDGRSPAWSLDGQQIAYKKNGQIFTINTNGTNETQITSTRNAWGPTYRPDSDQIYYMDNSTSGADFHWILWTNLDGSAGRNQVKQVPGGEGFSPPTFSPDGSQFTYLHYSYNESRARNARRDIMIANYDGSGTHSILRDDTMNSGVSWGKGMNSDKLAVTKEVNGVTSLYSVNTEGTDETRITSEAFGSIASWADWSYNGNFLTFARDNEIWTSRYDGTDFRLVTSDAYENYNPVFSPDMSQIAYASIRDGEWEIQVVDTSLAVVPEPISSTLFLIGGAALGFRRMRKKITN